MPGASTGHAVAQVAVCHTSMVSYRMGTAPVEAIAKGGGAVMSAELVSRRMELDLP
jgi:hypothetical protein